MRKMSFSHVPHDQGDGSGSYPAALLRKWSRVMRIASCFRRDRLSISSIRWKPCGWACAAGRLRRGVGLEQFLDGHFEGGGESQRRLCGNAELADFVIGDDRLDDVDALGQFALAESAQGANLRQTLAEGKVDGLVRVFGGVLTSRP